MPSKNNKSFLSIFFGALSKFIKQNKGALISALKFLIIKLLKFQAVGGIKGWIIKTIVKEFTEEVIDTIRVTVDYIEIRSVTNDTIDMEDRDEATDILNDIMR